MKTDSSSRAQMKIQLRSHPNSRAHLHSFTLIYTVLSEEQIKIIPTSILQSDSRAITCTIYKEEQMKTDSIRPSFTVTHHLTIKIFVNPLHLCMHAFHFPCSRATHA